MKKKRYILIITFFLIFLTLLIFIFFFNSIFSYKSYDTRKLYKFENKAISLFIDKNSSIKLNSVNSIIEQSLKITSKTLKYSFNQSEINPNKLLDNPKTHCVGYANFFSTTCNYLLRKQKYFEWEAKVHIGYIYFFKWNIHNLLNYNLTKNHDFVVIKNNKTEKYFAVDPTLHDLIPITYINYKK